MLINNDRIVKVTQWKNEKKRDKPVGCVVGAVNDKIGFCALRIPKEP